MMPPQGKVAGSEQKSSFIPGVSVWAVSSRAWRGLCQVREEPSRASCRQQTKGLGGTDERKCALGRRGLELPHIGSSGKREAL